MASPAELVQVTREEFFAFIMTANYSINPSVMDPAFSSWETINRRVVGRSYPGWKYPGAPKAYQLSRAALAELTDERRARDKANRAAGVYS